MAGFKKPSTLLPAAMRSSLRRLIYLLLGLWPESGRNVSYNSGKYGRGHACPTAEREVAEAVDGSVVPVCCDLRE